MYEKLDKLRTDLNRARQKKNEIEAKIKNLEQRLKEAEEAQILADVKQLNLKPEQVAMFLKLVASGQLPMPGSEEMNVFASEGTEAVKTEEPLAEQEETYEENYAF